jgi:hypothetical protein
MKNEFRMSVWVLFLAALLVSVAALAGDAAAAPQAAGQQDARKLLMGMAEFLGRATAFSVDVRSASDVVQESGQKIEFNETRKVVVSRPDRLRIDVTRSDGGQQVLQFDGKDITASSPRSNLYAQAASPGSVDDAVRYVRSNLHLRLPLAVLLMSSLPAELQRRVKSVEYIEKTDIFGVPAHRLAARTDSVDFQVWISAQGNPVPQRIVLTYREETGQPEYRAKFSDWNMTPKAADTLFAFAPAKDARKIEFLSHFKPAPAGTDADKAGGKP